MSIVALSPSPRGEIAELFIRDAATWRFCYALRDLVTLCTLSLRPRYDQRASVPTVLFRHSQPWRFCVVQVLLKVCIALSDSMTNSERFHSQVIEE